MSTVQANPDPHTASDDSFLRPSFGPIFVLRLTSHLCLQLVCVPNNQMLFFTARALHFPPVLSADCSAGSDITMSPEERIPMRHSSVREQDRHTEGTCFLLAASDYTCTADAAIRKTGIFFSSNQSLPFFILAYTPKQVPITFPKPISSFISVNPLAYTLIYGWK